MQTGTSEVAFGNTTYSSWSIRERSEIGAAGFRLIGKGWKEKCVGLTVTGRGASQLEVLDGWEVAFMAAL